MRSVTGTKPLQVHDVLSLLRSQARERGSTVLCSLHQLDLARTFADRVVALRGGRVIFDGPPEEMKHSDISDIYAKRDASETAVPLRLRVAL